MALTLTITSFHRLSPDLEQETTLHGDRLTIGRAQDNDWILEDPERVLSSHHCRIDAVADGYLLTDTSTNGVFVNQSPARMARGGSIVLSDGDQLRLGSFEIAVAVETPRKSTTAETDHMLPELDVVSPNPFSESSEAEAEPELKPWGQSPDLLGGAGSAEPVDGAGAIPDDYDPLAASYHGMPSTNAPAEPDHVSPEQAYFKAPAARPESIPNDWAGDQTAEPDTEEQRIPRVASVGAPSSAVAVTPVTGGVASPVPEDVAAAQALQAFLRGLGVSDVPVRGDPLHTLEEAGLLFRLLAQGTMEVLMARSQLKSEFRMAQTIIRPAENNPLKFSLSVEDALEKLLLQRGAGQMPARQAVEEALEDIKAHQVAVVAGMQAAIKHLLRRFDPETLRTRLGDQGVLENIMPAGRKARLWDRFNVLYEEIAREAEDDFQELFGKEFARAYEEFTSRK